MFSQLARGNSTSYDVAEQLTRSHVNAELMGNLPGDGLWTFAELLQKLDHHQKVSASWTTAIPYNEFTKPVLDVIDTFNIKIALAISKTMTLDSRSDNLGELGQNVHEANHMYQFVTKMYHKIKLDHGHLIDEMVAKYDAEIEIQESPEKRARNAVDLDAAASVSTPSKVGLCHDVSNDVPTPDSFEFESSQFPTDEVEDAVGAAL
jgi:hypothetical protein